MQHNTLSGFIAYFRTLALEHVALGSAQHFVHGSSARIVKGTRSKLKYPLLWLETPSLRLSGKDGTDPTGKRECALLILHNAPAGNDEAEDALWESTERLMLDVIARMRKDRKARLFGLEDEFLLEAVNTLTVANEIGWRVEFDMSKAAGLCYDATRWQEGGEAR